MVFVFWIVVAIGLLFTGYMGIYQFALGISHAQYWNLSIPARKILGDYRQLPPDSRPIGNIYEILTALDLEYGKKNVTAHFRDNGYDYNSFSWKCSCVRYGGPDYCRYHPEYLKLHRAIESSMVALKERKQRAALDRVSHHRSRVNGLIEDLNTNAQIISDTTKELM